MLFAGKRRTPCKEFVPLCKKPSEIRATSTESCTRSFQGLSVQFLAVLAPAAERSCDVVSEGEAVWEEVPRILLSRPLGHDTTCWRMKGHSKSVLFKTPVCSLIVGPSRRFRPCMWTAASRWLTGMGRGTGSASRRPRPAAFSDA